MPRRLAAAALLALAPLTAPGETAMESALDAAFAAGELEGLHAVYVLMGEEVLAERYYPGADEAWGRDLGQVSFDAGTQHDLRSVTKSVAGLLYGIALAEGAGPPVAGGAHRVEVVLREARQLHLLLGLLVADHA